MSIKTIAKNLKRQIMRRVKNDDTRDIFTMVRVKLKQNANKVYSKNPVRDAVIRNVIRVASFVLLTALIAGALKMSIQLGILTQTGSLLMNRELMITLYGVVFVVMLVTTVFRLVQQLYLDDDNKILLTLPVKQNSIFVAKMLSSFITNLQWSVLAFMPMFFAFGIVTGMGVVFYLMTILGSLLTVTAITLLAGLLSIPMLYVVLFVRRYQWVQVTIALLILGLITFLIFTTISAIPTELNLLRNFSRYYKELNNMLRWMENAFPPFIWLTQMFIGTNEFIPGILTRIVHHDVTLDTLWTVLSLIALIIAMAVALWYASRPLFLRMASKQFETNRKIGTKPRRNPKLAPFWSQVKVEAVDIYRNPQRFFNDTIYLFIMPFAVMLFNKVFLSMRISTFGNLLCMGGNIFLMAIMMLVSNLYVVSIFSREGVALPLMRTRPFSTMKSAAAKIFIKTMLALGSLGTSISIIYDLWLDSGKFSALNLTLVFFIVAVFYLAHLLWSMDMGLLNQQNAKYHDGVHDTGDPNEAGSFVVGFIICLLLFGAFVFFGRENLDTAYRKVFVFGIGLLILRMALSYVRVRTMLTAKEEVLR